MPLFPDWFARRREPARAAALDLKASRTARLMAVAFSGRPRWTPRDYAALSREGFAKNPIAYRCVRMIAEAAASIPLIAFADGRRAGAAHPLQRLLDRPNPDQAGPDLLEAFFGALQCAGNAYLEAAGEAEDGLRELYVLRPDRMAVAPGPDGWPEAYAYMIGGRTTYLRRAPDGWSPVLHLKLYNPLDDHYGFSPLEAAAFAIDVHNASGAWNKALLDNAARPSGALVYANAATGDRLAADQFERLKAELEEAHTGTAAAGRPLLLEGGLDWKPMSLTPQDMDFAAGKAAAAREIALAFGVPPPLLGIPGDNTYANFKEANAAFWRQTVVPLVQRAARALSAWLGPRFDGASLAPDLDQAPALSAERDALWARLEGASFLTPAERRRLAGLDAPPEQPLAEDNIP